MPNQESHVFNAYETTLATAMTALVTTMQVTAAGAVEALTYLVIDPDDPTKREVVMVGTVAGTTFSGLARYLSGSVAGSGLTHEIGAVVRSVAVQQMWEDVHDRLDHISNHANLSGLGVGDPHPMYLAETVVDAKGDLIAASGPDAVARLPVGINDTVLMADSAQPTGLKWVTTATPGVSAVGDAADLGITDTFSRGDHRHQRESFGNPVASALADTMSQGTAATVARSDHRHAREAGPVVVGCKAYRDSQQTLTVGIWNPVQWNAEVFDTHSFHDNSTNPNRFTIPAGQGGKYRVTFFLNFPGNFSGNAVDVPRIGGIRDSGASFIGGTAYVHASLNVNVVVSGLVSTVVELADGAWIEGAVQVNENQPGLTDRYPGLAAAHFSFFELIRLGT